MKQACLAAPILLLVASCAPKAILLVAANPSSGSTAAATPDSPSNPDESQPASSEKLPSNGGIGLLEPPRLGALPSADDMKATVEKPGRTGTIVSPDPSKPVSE